MLRETHLKIDLKKLEHNVNEIRKFIDDDVLLGAVIKANAYGHGAIKVAEQLYKLGVNRLLVSTLSEAVELKMDNSNYNVMIMGHTPDRFLEYILKHDIICTIFTVEQAKLLNNLAAQNSKKATIHLKIETGFNRLGMQIHKGTLAEIKKIYNMEHLIVEGAFTHLTLKNKESDFLQESKFATLMELLEANDIHIPIKHIVDSIGMVLYPQMHLSMVRVGALLYGLQSEEKGVLDVQQILSFHTKLSHQKVLQPGETISYGNRFVCETATRIGTLPFGYADGYPRNMYQKGEVTIGNKRYPIIGVICMDQCMIDLGDDTYTDEDVIIIGDGRHNTVSVEELAKKAETNKNDIVSRFTGRVPRVYI